MLKLSSVASSVADPVTSPLEVFIGCAHQMLDPTTPEAVRQALEPRLLAQLPVLRALGVFELFELRDSALRTWLQDEMAESRSPYLKACS